MGEENDYLLDQLRRLKNVMKTRATGGNTIPQDYVQIREELLWDKNWAELLPSFVRTCGTLDEFWSVIQDQARTYQERRTLIDEAFRPAFDHLEAAKDEGARHNMQNTQGSVPDRPVPPQHLADELIPFEIVKDTRGYVEKIVKQANGCYTNSWYDACAVMVRRLIEILIIDSFVAQNGLDDIREIRNLSYSVGAELTASDIRQFSNIDFPRLEGALNLVRMALGGSPLTDFSAASNWQSVVARAGSVPNKVSEKLDLVLSVRERAQRGISHIARDDLISAKKGIVIILNFLAEHYPRAGIQVPGSGEIVPLGRLIEAYVEAPASYWHVERDARSALPELKRIGDMGAHGRYQKVTKQSLDKHQEQLACVMGQLVGTAYSK